MPGAAPCAHIQIVVDRALKAKGYEVLRYSGTEIYNDSVAASVDLAEYLWSIERRTDA